MRVSGATRQEPLEEEKPSPELVFGLVGAVGTALDVLTTVVEASLQELDYTPQSIRLSTLFSEFDPTWKPKAKFEDERYLEQMDAGDLIRERVKRKDVMAILAIQKISEMRESVTGSKSKLAPRHAYVLRSLKTPEEVETLREVYGGGFFLIAGYSPSEARENKLLTDCAASRHKKADDGLKTRVREIMARDEKDSSKVFGQNVRDTFPRADLFVDMSQARVRIQGEIDRFIALIHGDEFKTPTPDEYGMFHARAASLRSAELGRQVGAAIANQAGELIALGANELPEAGGGLVWAKENEDLDHRDWKKGYDTNEKTKRDALAELLDKFKEANLLSDAASKQPPEELLDQCTDALKGSRVMSLTEFGRAVHAEMAAITDAARRGVEIDGLTLFTTTFPCHNCTRHIIAAGIKRVVYIEPYAKSLASTFHTEAVIVDELAQEKDTLMSAALNASDNAKKVRFQPFVGIAPRLFIPLFTMRERKDDAGNVILRDLRRAVPRHGLAPQHLSYFELEALKARDLLLALEQEGLSMSQPLLTQ